MNVENTLAGAALAAIKLPPPAQRAAKAALEATERAAAAKKEAVRVANSEDSYNRRRSEFHFAQAEKLDDLDEWVEFPEARPNLPLAQERAEALRRFAELKRREFEAVFDYRLAFDLIESSWRERVDWRRSVDAKVLSLAEGEKLDREADKARPALMALASMIATPEFLHVREKKEFRRAQSTAGRPLDLDAWRRDRDRKAQAGNKAKVEVSA